MKSLLRSVALTVLLFSTTLLQAANDTDVAVYDAILASVEPGQTTVGMGDMLVPVKLVRAWRDKAMGLRGSSQTDAALWPGGVVYYSFDNAVTEEKRRHFRDACEEWALFGNLTFTPRTNEPNYLQVQEDPDRIGGQSGLGMIGGRQFFTMNPDGWNRRTLLLVIGYTLGLTLEHQRSDRETYVEIMSGNVLAGWEGAFVRVFNSTNNTPYDFDSIMHYPDNLLSVSPELDVIVCRPAYAEHQDTMGRIPLDRWLSRQDRATIAQLYGPGPALSAVVTNTNDSGPGSLRAALYHTLDMATDAPASSPVISFHIPVSDPGYSGGVFTIRPTGRLPGPGPRVTVDGATQAAFTGDTNPAGPEIVLSGERITLPHEFGRGFIIGDDHTVVRGFVVQGCNAAGLRISGNNNRVEGCYIGTNASGTASVPNATDGVAVTDGAQYNIIGGASAAERNVISGNGAQGIVISGAGTSGNAVRGNYIGTNAAGTAALPNSWSGAGVSGGAVNNTVGPGNVISGNGNHGALISGASSSGNVVTGNYIGTDAAGTAALPNSWSGVAVNTGAANNTVGPDNVVSGNANQGVVLNGTDTAGNTVTGNYIGTIASGSAALPNAWPGVTVFGGATNNLLGPGNVISGNANQGVFVTGAGTKGNVVKGNLIGLNPAGTAALPNAWAGVQVNQGAQGNIVGGSGATDGNIISGNTLQGVAINGANTTGNLVRGNYIGTNAAGSAAIPNVTTGLEIFGGATGNIVGGPGAVDGNIISGNSVRGLSISGAGTNANVVAGNLIGLNAAGSAALANAGAGIAIFNGAQNNVIGAEAGGRNFIAGNSNSGIRISAAGTNGTRILGNSIGVTPGGTVVPNNGDGVEVFTGALNTVVGGSAPGSANLIRGNTRDGVGVFDAATVVDIAGNSIYENGGEGIDLGGNGVTANDTGDGDTGANGLQNFPVLSSAVLGAGTTIAGTLNTTANTAVRIDYYASASGDEGQFFIGSQSGTTNAGGTLTLNTTLAARVPAGHVITATATGPGNNTSEFSAPRAVTTTDGDSDGMPDVWESANDLASGSNDAALDADDDGESNLAEFRAGTDPRDPTSVLRVSLTADSDGVTTISFSPVTGFTCRVEYSPSMAPGSWRILADQLHTESSLETIADPEAGSVPRRFYRLMVVP